MWIVARVDEGNIEKDRFEYGLLSEVEKQDFVKHLKGLDFSAACDKKLERAMKEGVRKIIVAVIAGVAKDESLLSDARSYYYYFTLEMVGAMSA